MKEEDIKVTTTKIKPVSKPLRPSPSQPIIILPDRYIGIDQKSCPTCKGSGRDPKKRKRDCPNRACRGGQVPVAIHCACPCHEERGSCGFMSCCEYAGVARAALEAAE